MPKAALQEIDAGKEAPPSFTYPDDDDAAKGIVSILSKDADASRAVLALIAAHGDEPHAAALTPRLAKILDDMRAFRRAGDQAREFGLTTI